MLFPIFVVVLFFIFTVLNKSYWDYKMDRMCDVDAGDTVYQKVFLDKAEYTKNSLSSGVIIAPSESSRHRFGYDFLTRHEKRVIKKGSPKISRTEITIFRASDQKVLAKTIAYHRTGGDFPTVISRASGYHRGGNLNIGPLLSRTIILKEKISDSS